MFSSTFIVWPFLRIFNKSTLSQCSYYLDAHNFLYGKRFTAYPMTCQFYNKVTEVYSVVDDITRKKKKT